MDETHQPTAECSGTASSDCQKVNPSGIEEENDINNSTTNSGENQQADDSDLEMMETDDEEIEEITIIELSDTEICEEDEEDSADEEFVIKEEPVDDYGDGECINFDPSQLGVIVTETELPEDLIGDLVNGMYKCKFCPTKFADRNRLITHVERHIHNGTIRKCRFCEFYTVLKQTLLEHECKHTKEKLYQCNVCNHRCRLKSDLVRHQEVHTNSKRYQCSECGHRTRTAGNLKKHMERHWPDMPRNFVCRLCGSAFKRKTALRSHEKRRHSDYKPYCCDQCSFCSKTLWELTSHKAKHSDDHPYPCNWPNCTKSFKTKSDCSKHFKRHTGVKNHQCSICGKRFFNSTQLRKHGPTHSNVRNFECAQCLKRFKTMRALKSHLFTHQTVKPFPCDVCFKTFSSQSNLDMHKRVHEGGRPYQCPICVHGSREMDHLMAHVGSEHLHNFTYACGLCRKPFGKSFHLVLHFQRCHQKDQRGRGDTVIYEPDYLDYNFQPETSGAFDPATFAKYLAAENFKAIWAAENGVSVKQEPGVNNSSDDNGVSGGVNGSQEESSGMPDNLQLPPVVQLGMYRGIPFCLARKNSGIELNYQKKGKKPARWFMDTAQMNETDAERHKEYLRKKELGLLRNCWRSRTTKRRKKAGAKQRSIGKGRNKWQSRKISWTDEESDEEDVYLLAQQVVLQVDKAGTGKQSTSRSQRPGSRVRKPVVHFKNLPDDYFDIKPRQATTSKKAQRSSNSKAHLSHLQPSTSRYLGGKVAHRKPNKQIGKKKPQQLVKSTKKASLSNQTERKAKTGKKVKGQASGVVKCWTLALAGPLPVSHYRPEEAAINTQCWLNAVHSSVTRGQFGLAHSQQSKMDHEPGDTREQFFAKCLQLQVRTPIERAKGDLPVPPAASTSVSQEKLHDSEPAEHAPELSGECDKHHVDDVTGRLGTDSSSAEVIVHNKELSDLSKDHHELEALQAVSECLLNIVETVSVEQDSSHQVPLHRSSDSDRHQMPLHRSSDSDVNSSIPVGIISNNETGSLYSSEFSSRKDQTRKEYSVDIADIPSSPEVGSLERVDSDTVEEDSRDIHQQDESGEGSGKENLVSALQSDYREGSREDDLFSALQPESGDRENNSVSALHLESGEKSTEDNPISAVQPDCGESSREDSSVSALQPKSGEGSREDNLISALQPKTGEQSTGDNPISALHSKTGERSREDNSASTLVPVASSDTDTEEDVGYLPQLHVEEEVTPSKSCEGVMPVEFQSEGQNKWREELEVTENVVQKPDTEGDLKNSIRDESSAVHVKEIVQQSDSHKDRSQSEDNVNSKENCSAGLELESGTFITEACSEVMVHSDVNAQPQLNHTVDSQMEDFLPDVTDIRSGVDAEKSDNSLGKENGESIAHGTGCLTQVSHSGEQESSTFSHLQSVSETCSLDVQKCSPEESEPTVSGSEERIDILIAQDSAFEQAVSESSAQPVHILKCLHVLVSDVQCNPCSLDYLQNLGVGKVVWSVNTLMSNPQTLKTKPRILKPKHKIQKTKSKTQNALKHCRENTKKSIPKKETKQAGFKTTKSPPKKKQKANALLQKSSGRKASPVKSPRVKTESFKKDGKLKRLSTDIVSDSNILGISGLLLAKASTAKPRKLPVKTSSKRVNSKHRKQTGKSASSNSKQGKSASKRRQSVTKAKQLTSKGSPQKRNTKQLSGGSKQRQRKENIADGVWCIEEQEEDGMQHRPIKKVSDSLKDTVTVKLELEGHDVARGDISTTNKENAKLDGRRSAFSCHSSMQVLSSDRYVSKPNSAPAQKVTKRKRNIYKSSGQATCKTKIEKNSACKMTVTKNHAYPSKVSASDLSSSGDEQMNSINPGQWDHEEETSSTNTTVSSFQSASDRIEHAKKLPKSKQIRQPAKTSQKSNRKQKAVRKNLHGTTAEGAERDFKASKPQKISTAYSANKRLSKSSAFKITQPGNKKGRKSTQNKVKDVVKPGRKRRSEPNVENDATRKRKKYMYVETDTGEFPDPPAKKRGRPPGPKVILDRSQVNLCFGQSPLSAEQDQAEVCLTTDRELSNTVQSARSQNDSAVTCDESTAQLEICGMPSQFVQSVCSENLSELPVASETCLLQIGEGQLTECTPAELIDSGVADVKPTLSELSEYVLPDVKPRLAELSLMNGSASSEMVQTGVQATQSSSTVTSSGEEEEARAALLHVLTSHLDTWESGPTWKPQPGQSVPTQHPYVRPVLTVSNCGRGRKRKIEDRTFQGHPTYKKDFALLKAAERRRSDRKKKFRLTEEQIRQAAEQDSADSDFDWEETDDLSGPTYPPQRAWEDSSSDVEFLSADYSHVDQVSQRLSLENLRVNTLPLADISEEGEEAEATAVDEGGVSGSNITEDQNKNGAAGLLTGFPMDEVARGKQVDSGLNTQTVVSQQEDLLRDNHTVQEYSTPLESQADAKEYLSQTGASEKSVPQLHASDKVASRTAVELSSTLNNPNYTVGITDKFDSDRNSDSSFSKNATILGNAALEGLSVLEEDQSGYRPPSVMPAQLSAASPPTPPVPKTFTVKVSGGACVVVSMGEQSPTSAVLPQAGNQHGSPVIGNANLHQVPRSSQVLLPASQPTSGVGLRVAGRSPIQLTNQLHLPPGSGLSQPANQFQVPRDSQVLLPASHPTCGVGLPVAGRSPIQLTNQLHLPPGSGLSQPANHFQVLAGSGLCPSQPTNQLQVSPGSGLSQPANHFQVLAGSRLWPSQLTNQLQVSPGSGLSQPANHFQALAGSRLCPSQPTNQLQVSPGSGLFQPANHFQVLTGSRLCPSQLTNQLQVSPGSGLSQPANHFQALAGSGLCPSPATNHREGPIGAETSPSGLTSHVEVPLGSGPSLEGAGSLTISVKTSDGKNFFLAD